MPNSQGGREPQMENAHMVLRDIFGHSTFRLSQEAVIHRLLVKNQNALVLFPTGGGKSLTYQVPALCLPGLTLVISPLIALMKDQVDFLVSRGIKAASLDSTLEPAKASWVKGEVLSGEMKILYVAPERLNNESFIALMRSVNVSLLAVDESHCISQWGASFRPEYLKIARFAEERDVERVLCLTATATKDVTRDVCASFYIDPNEGVFRTPIFRPNLALEVVVAETFDKKLDYLIPFLKARTGPAIVYVTLQKHAELVANHLSPHGLEAMVYHAGLPTEQRTKIQMKFMESEKGIVCATIAFGMGIDKANIRQVVHMYMPKTLENYSQEVGRAGRDGLPSTCLMILSSPDIPILEGFCRGDTCSEIDMKLWLQEVALKAPDNDGTLNFNHYQQSRTYDMRMNVLGLCYAKLELDPNFGFIRAITPFYSVYDLTERAKGGLTKVMADTSPAGKAITMYWSAKALGYQIDVEHCSAQSSVDRGDLARKIHTWELDGLVIAKASQIRARYAVLKPFPKDQESLNNIAKELFKRMVQTEDEGIAKMKEVISFATDDDCLANGLATYFGDEDAVPDGLCGKCTFCKQGYGVNWRPHAVSAPDHTQILAILGACPERDDPRLLARMAFGITSPRLTANKWSTSHPLFGSMVNVEFGALVLAFDVECKKAGYTKSEVPAVSSSTTGKRKYDPQTAGQGRSSRGRGGERRPYVRR